MNKNYSLSLQINKWVCEQNGFTQLFLSNPRLMAVFLRISGKVRLPPIFPNHGVDRQFNYALFHVWNLSLSLLFFIWHGKMQIANRFCAFSHKPCIPRFAKSIRYWYGYMIFQDKVMIMHDGSWKWHADLIMIDFIRM